jgi:hypothetical protein
MFVPPDSMPSYYNSHHPNNLSSSQQSHIMPPHHSFDPNETMIPPPDGPLNYVETYNTNPLIHPSSADQQTHMSFTSMMSDSFAIGPPPPLRHPLHLNDGRSAPFQTINNAYGPATMPIQNLGPGEQAATIHYYASSENGPHSQQQPYPSTDQ